MERKRIHGVISLMLFAVALLVAINAVFAQSITFGIIYLIILPIGALLALMGFCPKCPHVADRTCRHVIPGEIMRLFPTGKTGGQYRATDYLILIVPILFIIGLPQIPLFKQGILIFGLFWSILVLVITEIATFVCNSFRNSNCPANKFRNQVIQ
ncbi:MAG: hypothetical protein GX639_09340 [Fibrobacter sp.]|nr:hypothetical protein [Fibrobacter sp.]